jgi:hypothetical protein
MLEIDLYKNYNLTVAEIFKEREAAEKEYEYVPREAPKKMPIWKKLFIAFAIFIPLSGIISTAIIYVFDPFYVPPVYAPDTVELAIPKQVDPLENFVKIQIIEFEPEEKVVEETENLPVVARPVEPKPAPAPTPSVGATSGRPSAQGGQTPPLQPSPAPTPPPPPAPVITQYVLEISGINRAEFDILSGIAVSRGAKVSITRDLSVRQLVWTIYAPASGTGLFVENMEVTRLAQFSDRGEAIAYAEAQTGNNIIIRAESETEVWYAVEICCMNIDDARLSAQESGITDKVFRIVPR